VGIVTLPGARTAPIRQFQIDRSATIVPLFDGEATEQFAIRVHPFNAYQANVIITNTTAEALNVALPKAAVGVHVLPQFQGNGNGFFGQQNGNGIFGNDTGQANGANVLAQAIGGTMQPGQNQNQNQNPFGQGPGVGNGFPSLPPEWADKKDLVQYAGIITIPPGKAIQLTLKSVCLNYGRPDPISKMTYRLVPVEKFGNDPVLAELLESYGARVDQGAMQAAAWHVANNMEWKHISNLPLRSLAATSAKLFQPKDVQAAQGLVDAAKERAPQRQKVSRPAEVARAEK
jgi:hypothetical protein